MASFEERFEVLARLHGAQGIESLRRAHVVVIASALGLPRRCGPAPSVFCT